MKSSQGFADGTYRELDMEQLDVAAGIDRRQELPVTEVGSVRVAAVIRVGIIKVV
jgi:hypothetical protein